jgi:XTP/dITP diphosphohydrolase
VPDDLLAAASDDPLYADIAAGTAGTADPEGALRVAADELARRVHAAEDAARAAGEDPAALDAEAWARHWPA